MKKYLNTSIVYAFLAIAAGVFYREFTKLQGFAGETMLKKIHPHLFVLGTLFFLIVAVFARHHDYHHRTSFKTAYVIYNVGLGLTTGMMLVRGVLQVLGTALSEGVDTAISGIAGFAHITLGLGVILFLFALRKTAKS